MRFLQAILMIFGAFSLAVTLAACGGDNAKPTLTKISGGKGLSKDAKEKKEKAKKDEQAKLNPFNLYLGEYAVNATTADCADEKKIRLIQNPEDASIVTIQYVYKNLDVVEFLLYKNELTKGAEFKQDGLIVHFDNGANHGRHGSSVTMFKNRTDKFHTLEYRQYDRAPEKTYKDIACELTLEKLDVAEPEVSVQNQSENDSAKVSEKE